MTKVSKLFAGVALLAYVLFAPKAHALTLEDILHCPPPSSPEFVRADEKGTITVQTPTDEPLLVTKLPPCFQVEKNKLFSKASQHSSKGTAYADETRNTERYCECTEQCFHIKADTNSPREKKHPRARRTAHRDH